MARQLLPGTEEELTVAPSSAAVTPRESQGYTFTVSTYVRKHAAEKVRDRWIYEGVISGIIKQDD